jgi:hypothetical protein
VRRGFAARGDVVRESSPAFRVYLALPQAIESSSVGLSVCGGGAAAQVWRVRARERAARNAFFELWRRAQSEANWFTLMLKASDTGLIPASELALAKRDLSEEQYAQEFECSFDTAVVGAYYGKLMARAEAERRIAGVPYDPAAPVWTSWDLGIRDATAIWCLVCAKADADGQFMIHVLAMEPTRTEHGKLDWWTSLWGSSIRAR